MFRTSGVGAKTDVQPPFQRYPELAADRKLAGIPGVRCKVEFL